MKAIPEALPLFIPKPTLMCLEPIISLLKYPVVAKFQLFSSWFKLETLEAVLLIH